MDLKPSSPQGLRPVLLIGYSHVLENRWKEKLGINEKQSNTNKKQTKDNTERHPGNYVKLNAFRNPQAAQYCSAMP